MTSQYQDEQESKSEELERQIDQMFTEAADRCGIDPRKVPNYRDPRGDELDD